MKQITALLLALLVLAAPWAGADEASFRADLEALTAAPHRLAGTPEGVAAGDHIIERLKQIGVDRVQIQEFPMWQTDVRRCVIQVDGKEVPLLPLRPNLMANPVTPPQGLTGPMVYVGKGSLIEITSTLDTLENVDTLENAIVVMDYDSYSNWEIAFSMGASAVVFLGDDAAVNADPMHAAPPINLVRLYASVDPQTGLVNGVDLTRSRPSATVHSAVTWQRTVGRNIIGLVEGTDPAFVDGQDVPELLILASHYDSFGNVPRRSPGARGAANVAALLDTAARAVAQPPRRHVALLFLDNQARAHQGARAFYDALLMTDAQHQKLTEEHDEEVALIRGADRLLEVHGLGIVDLEADEVEADLTEGGTDEDGPSARSVSTYVRQALKEQADWAQDDVQARLQTIRMSWIVEDRLAGEQNKDEAVKAQREAIEVKYISRMRRWDDLRRALHEETLPSLIAEVDAVAAGERTPQTPMSKSLLRARESAEEEYGEDAEAEIAAAMGAEAEVLRDAVIDEVVRLTQQRIQSRLDQLALQQRGDEQRGALRQMLGEGDERFWATLHATFDFGDATPVWGPVVGEWSPYMFSTGPPSSGVDDPGFYIRLLTSLRDLVDEQRHVGFEAQTVRGDTSFGPVFAPGQYVNGGTVAGQYSIYNFALMTGYDRRQRDGHPADTLDNLGWQRLYQQSSRGADLMLSFADSVGLSQPRRFSNNYESLYVGWSNGKPNGPSATLQVIGGLSENRPASGALVTIWPGPGAIMSALEYGTHMPNFEPVIYEMADINGNFNLLSVRKDRFLWLKAVGGLFDERGWMEAISSEESVQQKIAEAIRTDLFYCKPFGFVYRPTYRTQPTLLKVLRANANSPYRPNRSMVAQVEDHSVFFIADQVVDDRSKVFQTMGPVALGEFTEERKAGTGTDAAEFTTPRWMSPRGAEDLWQLNESRLSRLRARGVTRADLENLHSQAGRMLERAQRDDQLGLREAGLTRAQMLAHRVYGPLRSSMDDLVHSVVLLLLLAIPFAFFMERLLICASSIYSRIAGFVVTFLVTFGLLYWLHPGFAIASTPIIIFLAFAIILLSSLVIYIVSRKFTTELRAIQGQGQASHELATSTTGAMLAAVSMGISTMRRRPTRTTLTAVTVVMLTFTILCFASFTTAIGVRSVYEGPVTEGIPDAILTRNLDYSEMQPALLEMVQGMQGDNGLIAPNYWAVATGEIQFDPPSFSIADPRTGKMEKVNAVMGVDAAELERWPQLAAVIRAEPDANGQIALGDDDIYLPSIIQNLLKTPDGGELQVGDRILVNGISATFRGTIQGEKLQNLRHVDSKPALPVDFMDETNWREEDTDTQQEDDVALASDVQRDFTYLSSDQVALASNELVRRLGGRLHRLSIYPDEDVNTLEQGKDLAKLVVMPVWAAGDQGVDRMLLTRLTSVAGGMRLAVPLLLGGLIIFGTLLGSISDREREIYTFSALGLSPTHVGILFFAEATVYAVVGGMGGQLLAQFVALAVSGLTKAGLIGPVSINYSSTNSLFAIGVVMATVIISAMYPAYRASKSANPGLARAWRLPKPEDDDLNMVFPFTVSAYDITGIVSFLAEHFRRHDDAGLGNFAASETEIGRSDTGQLQLYSELALAPFDLGVTQEMTLTAIPSEIPGVDEVSIQIRRHSGTKGDWVRANKVFIRSLRRQFLLWRTLGADMIEQYRMETLQTLNEANDSGMNQTQPQEVQANG